MSTLVKKILCKTPEQFEVKLRELESLQLTNNFILFTGTKNQSTGLSWCPDCVRAEPLIDNVFLKVNEPTGLLICDVEREPYRTQAYIYRNDPRVHLRCVPTLMRWELGKASNRLNDIQCQSLDNIEEFVLNY